MRFNWSDCRQRLGCAVLAAAGLLATGCGPQHGPRIGQGSDAIQGGIVRKTANPQVARYTIRTDSPARVTVEFGQTKDYGTRTWTVAARPGHPVRIFVAGMYPDTLYHMRAIAQFADGRQVDDQDHTFKTGHYRERLLPRLVTETDGDPQPGVELLNPSIGRWYQAMVTDLDGHVLWAYNYSDRESTQTVEMHRYLHAAHLTLHGWWQGVEHLFGAKTPGRLWNASLWKPEPPERRFATIINPIKTLPNGDFVMLIGLASHALLDSPDGAPPPDTTVALREINLAGQTVRNLPVSVLNQRLRAHGYTGPTLEILHHDVKVLPDGHMILIANGTREYTNLPGRPGTTRVIGDVLVDLDQNWQPVWTWNEFDHLDVNRHPVDFPDWTHTNALVYTKDDGNLIVSMRSQSWVMKIDYDNGHGSGKILWTLGNGGDLRLIGGQAPEDWSYGQHQPAIFGNRDAGVFELGMMDNGYGRPMSNGKLCGAKAEGVCYTTASVYRIDEKAKTATLVFRKKFPSAQYSFWGGGVRQLGNGDIEIDLCNVGHDSDIYEMTMGVDPKTVWQMHASDTNVYRAQRMGSLYPGVTW